MSLKKITDSTITISVNDPINGFAGIYKSEQGQYEDKDDEKITVVYETTTGAKIQFILEKKISV